MSTTERWEIGLRHQLTALRAGTHVGAAWAEAALGVAGLPRFGHLYFTMRCPGGQCRSCNCQPDRWPELGTADLKSVLSRLSCLDVVKVLGGDPFVREDMPDLVAFIRSTINPHILQLNTTGQHLDAIRETVVRSAWPGLHLRLAMDGVGASHDWERGAGSYSRMRETLEELASLRATHRFSLGVNFHMTERSRDQLTEAESWARSLGIGLHAGIPVKPALFTADPSHAKAQSQETVEALRSSLSRSPPGSGYGRVSRAFIRWVNLRATSSVRGTGGTSRFRCRELRSLVYMLPDGSVVACGMKPTPVGNLLQTPIEELWRAPEAKAAREGVDACLGCAQTSVMITSRLYGGPAQDRPKAAALRRILVRPTAPSDEQNLEHEE